MKNCPKTGKTAERCTGETSTEVYKVYYSLLMSLLYHDLL